MSGMKVERRADGLYYVHDGTCWRAVAMVEGKIVCSCGEDDCGHVVVVMEAEVEAMEPR